MDVRARTGLTRAEWISVAKAAKDQAKNDDVSSLAAGVAYRFFISLFPTLIAAVAIFSLVADPERLQSYLDRAAAFVPDQALGLVQQQLQRLVVSDSGAGGIAVVALLGGLFAALSAAQATMKALNRAEELQETRGFIKVRLVGTLLMVALLLALVGLVVLLVLGSQVTEWLFPAVLLRNGLGVLVTLGRYLAAILLLVMLFGFVYAVGPARTSFRWAWITPGALLGVVGWLLVSYGFSIYTRTVGSYSSNGPYGAFAGVIVLLIWLQLTFVVLLFGAELNQQFERVRAQSAGAAESPPAPAELTPPHTGVPPRPRANRAGRMVGALALIGVALLARRRSRT